MAASSASERGLAPGRAVRETPAPGPGDNGRVMLRPPRRFALYLVVSAVLVGAAVLGAGFLASAFFERHVLREEEGVTAEVVQGQARQHLTAADFASPGPASAAAFEQFMDGLPRVFRIKAFDRSGRIVWSNETRLVGQRFPESRYLQAALQGRVTTVLEETKRAEHVFEQDRRYVAEAYVPVVLPGDPAPVGVVETYKDMTGLIAELGGTQRRIWTVAATIGALLYVSLAFVVWQASARELRAITRLEAQTRELALLHSFSRALLGPLELPALAGAVVDGAGSALGLARAALLGLDAGGRAQPLAAWPAGEPALVPPTSVMEAAAARGGAVLMEGFLAIPLVTGRVGRYLFAGQPSSRAAALEGFAVRPLEIMLREAAVAFANVELFTEVREAHERLAAILAAIVDRLVIVDRDLRVVWMNEAAAAARGDGLGRTCYEVMGAAPEVCASCPAVRTLRTGGVERGMRAEPQPDGHTRYLDLVTAPLRDESGEVRQVLEVSRDITELVEMEERLKSAHQALLDAQSQLIEKERLAAIGQLVVGLHHAVLNPLTGILGALQVLRQGDLGPEARLAAIDAVEEEARKIEQLVRRLPDLRRADEAPYVGGTTMLDLERSGEDSPPPAPRRNKA